MSNPPILAIPHFEEPGRQPPRSNGDRLSDPVYSQALDHLVFTCVDLVFSHQGKILLAQRTTYPRRSWWVIGGRMIAGENPIATAQRKAREEAQLHSLAANRFHLIGVYSTVFARRAQPPVENGSHSVNLTYQVELTAAEKRQIQLVPSEYAAQWHWLNRDQIAALTDPADPIDRALLQIMQDLSL